MRRLAFRPIILILFFLVFLREAEATTYTVCASGCDHTTIQAAVNAATTAGDIVEVQADTVGGSKTYAERVITAAAGAPESYITIKARTGDTIIISHATDGGFAIGHAYIKIDGFSITGASTNGGYIHIRKGATNRGSNCYISNNTIYDEVTSGTGWTENKCTGNTCYRAGGAGIKVEDTATVSEIAGSCTITGNTLRKLRYQYFYIFGDNHIISNNTITGYNDALTLQMNDSDAFLLFGSGHLVSGNEIYNMDGRCLDDCSNCGGGGSGTCGVNHTDFIQSYGDCGSAACQENQNNTISRNFVHDCKGFQIGQVSPDTYGATIRNWTFSNNIFSKVSNRFASYVANVKWYNNVFYKCEDESTGGNGQDPLQWEGANATGGEAVNNIFIGCARTDDTTEYADRGWYSAESGGEVTGTNNYVSKLDFSAKTGFSETGGVNGGDPKLVNVAAGSAAGFSLTSASTLLINAGADLHTTFTIDYLGNTRAVPFDIGAYEYYEQGSIHGVTSMGVSKK